MKQRVKFALADIRYIQTQIEKILNPPNSKGHRVDMADGEHKSGEKMSAGSPRKNHNFSTSPRQIAKGRQRQMRMTSPKMRKKQSPQSKSQTLHATTIKKDNNSNKSIAIEVAEQRKVERKESSPPQLKELPKEESKEVSPHKSIMMMWKEKEKSGAVIQPTPVPIKTNTLTKIKEVNQQKSPMKVYSPPKEQFRPAPIIVVQAKEVPYHLKETNTIPLRTDEGFLIKKYHYNENKQKEEELREKYRLLDERLQRLKGEIKNRDFFVENGDNQRSKESSALKKNAMEKYSRYSPLSKFVRINQKLRRDYERSLSNQERRVLRQRAELESTKPKWAH